ncbi:MAG: disulfide bond formation protein DsbA [Bacteroidia bacterium 44-10]|nr:MAG: disulfide bond formation protein DsbA [Bacteroidia bacterium 44-10]
MKVEIWSDVMCPFCYMGKRKFELALAEFEHKDNIEIVWKSYQLMPELDKGTPTDLEKILVEKRGIDINQARQMNAQVAQAGKQVGIEYNFDKALAVNTFDAHRFLQFAKANGKANEAEEVMFRSYFTDGKNVGDYSVLIQLGKEIGLDSDALKTALENGSYANEVRADISEAQQVGVRGVPFFVFNRKQAVSGAQDPQTFLQTLEKSFVEWRKDNPETKLEIIDGKVCTPDGECD